MQQQSADNPVGMAATTTTSSTKIIGEVKKVKWYIPDFFSEYRGRADVMLLDSNPFPFAEDTWSLEIWPDREALNDKFKVFLRRKGRGTECINVQCTLGFKRKDGQVEKLVERLSLTYKIDESFAFLNEFFKIATFKRIDLLRRSSELMRHGMLTLICTLQKGDAVCTLCHRTLSPAGVETATQTELDKCTEKLCADLKELMLSGDESDFTVVVQGEEFRLHRNILCARTSVIRTMLTSEMMEKATGRLRIDDFDPGTFRQFLRYVYSGKLDDLSTDTVFELYTLADKYQEDELKSECLRFVEATFSEDTFCDVVQLAMTYDLADLLERATDYFAKNTKAIVQTENWISFMKDHHLQANELYFKALCKIAQSKDECCQKAVAKKYGHSKKERPVRFVEATFSEDTFCEVVQLAMAYDLADLLERATDYFAKNTKAIVQTENWISFMKDHHLQANELYFKALCKIAQSKDECCQKAVAKKYGHSKKERS